MEGWWSVITPCQKFFPNTKKIAFRYINILGQKFTFRYRSIFWVTKSEKFAPRCNNAMQRSLTWLGQVPNKLRWLQMSPYDGRSEKLIIVNILRDQTGTAFGDGDRSTPLLDDDNCDEKLGSLILIRGGPRGPRYCLKLPVRRRRQLWWTPGSLWQNLSQSPFKGGWQGWWTPGWGPRVPES